MLTRGSARLVRQAFGDTWSIEQERREPPLRDQVTRLPRGTPFVLALLRAYRDVPLDVAELTAIVGCLTGRTATLPTDSVYTVMIGRTGEPPAVVRSELRPFRLRMAVGDMTWTSAWSRGCRPTPSGGPASATSS